jgi:hypothetical protein
MSNIVSKTDVISRIKDIENKVVKKKKEFSNGFVTYYYNFIFNDET